MILRGDEAALIYKISTETWEAPKIGSFCCIIPSETKTNMRPLRKRNTLVTGLYANFFRIFVQFVSNSLWSKCNSKQCVWPEISMCGLLKRGFSTQRGNYTVTNPGLDKGRNMAWYPFRAMRGLLISTKRKDFRQGNLRLNVWFLNWKLKEL